MNLTDNITYRELHTMDELNRVFELEQVIWDMTAGDAVPAALLIGINPAINLPGCKRLETPATAAS